MKLQSPFAIGSRLLPSLDIGGATLSLDPVGCRGNRLVWRWYVDFADGREFSAADLSGAGSDSPAETQRMFGSLLAFLSAFAEAHRYSRGTGRESDNANLFPPEMADWAMAHCDEIDAIRCDLEESGECFLADDDE